MEIRKFQIIKSLLPLGSTFDVPLAEWLSWMPCLDRWSKKEKEYIIDIGSETSEIERFEADQDMYIISTRVNPPVDTGDRIAFAALKWEERTQ